MRSALRGLLKHPLRSKAVSDDKQPLPSRHNKKMDGPLGMDRMMGPSPWQTV
jgi:hypothetical protein